MARSLDAAVEEENVTRRRFLNFVAWGSFASFFGGVTLATLRFLFPRILYEPSLQFVAGKPDDYQVGEVSTRMKKEQRVWMIRNEEGMFALISICTHLGCTPIYHQSEDRIKCPCHGSVFLVDGTNIAGPAPFPLRRAGISLDLAGNVVVDKAVEEPTQDGVRATEPFNAPPYFLPLSKA